MAATKRSAVRNAEWIEQTRQKIKHTLLIKKLQSHVLDDVKMTNSQVRAGLGLLAKVLPDLSESDDKREVTINHIMRLPAPQSDLNEWQRVHGDPLKALPKPTTVQ